mgnify:CR=1 FL=1
MILKSLVKNIRCNIYKTLIIKMELTGKKVRFYSNLGITQK